MQSRMSCIQKKNKIKPTKEPKTKQNKKNSNKKIPYSLEYTTWLKKKKKKKG